MLSFVLVAAHTKGSTRRQSPRVCNKKKVKRKKKISLRLESAAVIDKDRKDIKQFMD